MRRFRYSYDGGTTTNVASHVDDKQPAVRVYMSNERTLVEDVESVITVASGGLPEREPTRVVGRVDLDAVEAHSGTTKRIELYERRADQPAPRVPVPPKARDLDSLVIGPDEVAIVRIVPARDRLAVRAVASAALLLSIGFLLFLLAL